MLNTIDLFVGCGGLSEGFEQSRKYKMIGAVEWEPSPVKELRNHLKNRWGIQDSEERVLQFDIQRTEELFNGWKDKKFGESKGLDALVGNRQLDVIIGGPPCQASCSIFFFLSFGGINRNSCLSKTNEKLIPLYSKTPV